MRVQHMRWASRVDAWPIKVRSMKRGIPKCPPNGEQLSPPPPLPDHKNQVRHTAELEWGESMTDRSEQMLYV